MLSLPPGDSSYHILCDLGLNLSTAVPWMSVMKELPLNVSYLLLQGV